jgi:hypothetical protein
MRPQHLVIMDEFKSQKSKFKSISQNEKVGTEAREAGSNQSHPSLGCFAALQHDNHLR